MKTDIADDIDIQIPYDIELRCPICNSIGLNVLEEEDWVIGDEVKGKIKWIVCECGHAIKEIEDEEL